MLILAEAARSGFARRVDGSWEVAPGVKELSKFLSVERAALQTLGLERQPKLVGPRTIAEWLKQRDSALSIDAGGALTMQDIPAGP